MGAYEDWAARRGKRIVYTAELTAARRSDGQDLTLRWATVAGQWDEVHNWRPNILEAPRVRWQAQGIFGQPSLITFSDLVCKATRGDKADSDALITMDELLAGYTFDGRQIVVKHGGPGLAWAEWKTVLKGVMGQPDFDNVKLSLPMESPGKRLLETKLPPNEYGNDTWPVWSAGETVAAGAFRSPPAGNGHYYEAQNTGTTGGSPPAFPTSDGATVADGGVSWVCRTMPEASEGRTRFWALGPLFNAGCVLIDEASHTYQFSDPELGPLYAITAVKVDGVPTGYTPVGSDNCTIRFGSDPGGHVTADLSGWTPGGSFVQLPGDIIKAILIHRLGEPTENIDTAAFAAYNTTMPWPVGLHVTSKHDAKSVIGNLLSGLLTDFTNTREGLWTIWRLVEPAGSPDVVIEERNIRRDSWKSKADPKTPAWKVTLECCRNWSPLASPSDTLDEATRARLKERYKEVTAKDEAVLGLYPQADELGPYQVHLVNEAHAQALAALWLAVAGVERALPEFEIELMGLPPERGAEAKIIRTRHGMSGGKPYRIFNGDEDHHNRKLKFGFWGPA